MQNKPKQYLGDSVYAAIRGGMLILTTENGATPSNTICLEDAVLRALHFYLPALPHAPLQLTDIDRATYSEDDPRENR